MAMRTAFRTLVAAAIALAPSFVPGEAKAAACLTSDVSLTIAGTVHTPISCADNANQGGGPNAETASMRTILGLASLAYLDSSEGAAGPGLGGIGFAVTAPQTNSGGWNVSWAELMGAPNLPITVDVVVGLFGGNNGAAYLFANVLLTSSPTSGTGLFDINFLNNGGQQPALSHLILAGTGVTTPPTPVPEPASLALLGLGLAGLGAATRRRRPSSSPEAGSAPARVSSPEFHRRGLLLGAGAAALTGCMAPGPDGVADFTHLNIPVRHDIAYGDHPQQMLDVYPAAASRLGNTLPRRPAVVFFHGGFWQFGSRSEAPVQTVCSHLAARGITAIAAGYRLYPETNHRGILEDAAQAVAWAIRHGEAHGAAPGRVVASGHSAGGWMSAMLHVRPQLVHQALDVAESNRHPLAGTVGVAGPYAHWPTRFPLLFNLFEGVPTEQRLPNTYVSANLPPSLLVQGMFDTIVWPPNAMFFARDLERAGNRSNARYYLREHMTVMPVMGLLPGSLALVDDIEAFVKSPGVMSA